MTAETDPILAGYWKKILDDWDDDARHKTFVAYCAQTMQLEEAARLYRAIAEEPASGPGEGRDGAATPEGAEASPEAAADAPGAGTGPAEDDAAEARRADAKKRLQAVAAAAVLMLDSAVRTQPIDVKRFSRQLGLGFLAVIFAVLAYLLWVVFGPRGP